MTTVDVVVLALLILAGILAGLRTVGVAHPRLHFGWAAVTILILIGIIIQLGT